MRFAAAGGHAQRAGYTDAVLKAMAQAAPDANFTLGDLSYGSPGGEQAWCDYVKQYVGQRFPFELLSEDHESNGEKGYINDFSACLPNQLPGVVGTYGRQYYVEVPQNDPLVRVTSISPGLTYPDGTSSYSAGSARYQWTSDAIDSARAAGVPWVVVNIHKPCITTGTQTCDSGLDVMNPHERERRRRRRARPRRRPRPRR